MEWQNIKATDYLFLILGIWLALLSFYLVKNISNYKRLSKWAKSQGNGQFDHEQNTDIYSKLKNLETLQKESIHKVQLMRFNPFEDTGGDQSFVAAFLDANNNGIVISSLHSRGGTRVYAKQVNSAKSTTHQFSKEEKEVVEKAARQA